MAKEHPHIRIRGARVHNLKNIDIDIPLGQLVCFAGPSGSGKTSLAFHTLLSESRRRFVNSFPNSMKFFADRPAAVDVDEIYPVLPVFGLPQINPVMGARTNVADVMRITELLQGLFFNYAKEYCPKHDAEVEIVPFSKALENAITDKKGEVWHLVVEAELGKALLGESFTPARSWGSERKSIGNFESSDEYWEVLRFKASTLASLDTRNADMIPKLTGRPLFLWAEGHKKLIPFSYASKKQCPQCDYSGRNGLKASAFSPHSALGACKTCNGYGANLVFDETKMIDRDLSVDEDGIAFLKFGPLDWWSQELRKAMKRNKWSTSEPIKKLPKEFFRVLEDGERDWEGFVGVKKYLESKRYKPAVRVFIRKMQKEITCVSCGGSRLDESVKNFKLALGGKKLSLFDFSDLSLSDFNKTVSQKTSLKEEHARKLIQQLADRSELACSIGLNHLLFNRKARSLSAGEYQRLLILKYLSFDGTDALFVLDEPSLGLGEKEQNMLIAGLRRIIAQGNSVIVVDHSQHMQKSSDYLVFMGPDSGHRGGEILFKGKTAQWKFTNEATFYFEKTPAAKKGMIEVSSAQNYGMNWGDFQIPKGQLVSVSGPSGSGKTSRVVNVLAQSIHRSLYREDLVDEPGKAKSIKGISDIKDVIVVDSNLNRFTSRSTVGTLTDMASAVRKHFLKLPVTKAMDLKDGHLSSNSELGMCLYCEGRGFTVVEMQYLEDIVLPCDECKGKKIKPLYADISDGVMTLSEALSLPMNQVFSRIAMTPKYQRTFEYMKILNLDYLAVDRQLNSLSGGERQRIYLLSKLVTQIEDTLLVLENLSFGLSAREIRRVGEFLHSLTLRNNTIIVIDSDPLFAEMAHTRLVM
jgi:excinuclease ABC subunit A